MTKKQLIDAMGHLNDDDHVMMDETAFPYIPEIKAICGKGQRHMIYHCVLPPGHDGLCYCSCKSIEFSPDD